MTSLHRKLLRELWRMRGQALAIAVVIAGGVAMLIMALSSFDSLTLTRDAFYRDYRFADVFASLKRAPESLREPIEAIPGVQHVETRVVGGANLDLPGFTDPVTAELVSLPDGRNAELNRLYLRAGRLPRAGHEAEAVVSEAFAALQGFEAGSHLRRVLDEELRVVELPPAGVLLNDFLADYLGAGRGDRITVEFLEGRREVREVTVAGVVREFTGVAAYMELDALNRLLGEGDAISGALLAVQPGYRESIIASFNDVPQVLGVTDRLTAIESFYDSMAGSVLTQAFISTLLAASIAFGVVYNNARIALTERSRELASLRVLGFTRGEIAYILLGELALLTAAAIPMGFLIGTGLTYFIVQGVESDLYRIPLVLEPGVFAFAATVIALSALLSGLIVARRLRRLDLVAVLKTRE